MSPPFSVDHNIAPGNRKLELIELHSDAECRNRQQQLSSIDFYSQLDKERFKEIRTFASKMRSLFGSTYFGEQTF